MHRIRAPLVLPPHTARKPPRQQRRHFLASFHGQRQRGVAVGIAGDAAVLVAGVDEELLPDETRLCQYSCSESGGAGKESGEVYGYL